MTLLTKIITCVGQPTEPSKNYIRYIKNAQQTNYIG